MFTMVGSRAGRNRRAWNTRSNFDAFSSFPGKTAKTYALDITGPAAIGGGSSSGDRTRFSVDFGAGSGVFARNETMILGSEYGGNRAFIAFRAGQLVVGTVQGNQQQQNDYGTENFTFDLGNIGFNGAKSWGLGNGGTIQSTANILQFTCGSTAGTSRFVNTTNAQKIEVYGTSNSNTAPTTFTRAGFSVSAAGALTIATEADGVTNTAGPLNFSSGGSTIAAKVDTSNRFIAGSVEFDDGYVSICSTRADAQARTFGQRAMIITTASAICGVIGNANAKYGWSSSTAGQDVGVSYDTALMRNAAGVVEINNGTAGSFRAIKAAAFVQAQGTLTDAASIAWDVQANQSGIVTLGATVGATRALANPTNAVAGTTYILVVKQDATGSRALTYGTQYKWPGGTAPVLSTAANATDVLTFIYDGTNMLGVAQKAFA